MLFFKRILDVSKAPEFTPHRRAASRHVVHPEFPVTGVRNLPPVVPADARAVLLQRAA